MRRWYRSSTLANIVPATVEPGEATRTQRRRTTPNLETRWATRQNTDSVARTCDPPTTRYPFGLSYPTARLSTVSTSRPRGLTLLPPPSSRPAQADPSICPGSQKATATRVRDTKARATTLRTLCPYQLRGPSFVSWDLHGLRRSELL